MVKKRVVGFVVGLLVLALVGFYIFEGVGFVNAVSGNFVSVKVTQIYETSSFDNRLSLLFKFVAGIIIVVLIFLIIRKIRKKRDSIKQDFFKEKTGASRTDLDTLYEVLKRKKKVNMYDVERAFKIDSKVAIEWAKILENGDLAVIDYPRFGKPVLLLVEDEKEDVEVLVAKTVTPKKQRISVKGKRKMVKQKKQKVHVKSKRKKVLSRKKVRTSASSKKKIVKKVTKRRVKK